MGGVLISAFVLMDFSVPGSYKILPLLRLQGASMQRGILARVLEVLQAPGGPG